MSAPLSFERAAERVLAFLSTHLPLAVWSVTRVENGQQTYVYLEESNSYGLVRGSSTPWEQTFCIHAVAGRTPSVTAQAQEVPEYRESVRQTGVTVTTYASATILEPDGRLFGTVCGFDPASVIGPDDLASAIALLAFMGDMLTLALAADRERQDLHEALADSEVDAETDALTGLANRRRWDRMVNDEEQRFRRLADPTVVVIVDLDGLKRINDSEGHADGDGYLRAAADALRASVRSTDVVARLGGDEFAVLLRQCDAGTASDVVAKLEASLADRHVEASIGWSVANVGSGLSTAVAEADARMYAQKATRVAR